MSSSHHPNSLMIPNLTVNVAADDEDAGQPTPISQAAATPSTAGFLSPTSPMGGHSRSASLEAPYSPSSTEYDGSSIPPSPTLSNRSSVHFQTSLALRDNKVDARSGASSLGLLSPTDGRTHRRKGSNATVASTVGSDEETGVELQYVKTNNTGSTSTHVDVSRPHSRETRRRADSDTATAVSASTRKGKRKDSTDSEKGERVELEQDREDNPAPFAFGVYQLARMLDPKSLDTLTGLGGVDGLLKGLGTDRHRGLTKISDSTHRSSSGPGDGRPGAGPGASQNHEPDKGENEAPAITIMDPEGEVKPTPPGGDDHNYSTAYSATLEDRRHIYGQNVLPERPSKSLLQLMITALKDKVLVCRRLFPAPINTHEQLRFCFQLLQWSLLL
jgi:P-type Ca2+ transporter type 2C